MKQHRMYLIAVVILLLALLGCDQQGSLETGGESSLSSGAQPKQPLTTSTAASGDATEDVDTDVTSKGGFAPPYDEIKRNIDRLVGRNEHGGGPEAGPDGIADPKIAEAFGDYNIQLRGKKVVDWHGWVDSFAQSDLDNPNTGFNLSIFMSEPKPGDKAHHGVLQLDVSREQVEKLKLGVNLDQAFGTTSSPKPRVVFSGTIAGAFHNGQVLLRDVSIHRIE